MAEVPEIERYEQHMDHGMLPLPSGGWVRYSDHCSTAAALQAKVTEEARERVLSKEAVQVAAKRADEPYEYLRESPQEFIKKVLEAALDHALPSKGAEEKCGGTGKLPHAMTNPGGSPFGAPRNCPGCPDCLPSKGEERLVDLTQEECAALCYAAAEGPREKDAPVLDSAVDKLLGPATAAQGSKGEERDELLRFVERAEGNWRWLSERNEEEAAVMWKNYAAALRAALPTTPKGGQDA